MNWVTPVCPISGCTIRQAARRRAGRVPLGPPLLAERQRRRRCRARPSPALDVLGRHRRLEEPRIERLQVGRRARSPPRPNSAQCMSRRSWPAPSRRAGPRTRRRRRRRRCWLIGILKPVEAPGLPRCAISSRAAVPSRRQPGDVARRSRRRRPAERRLEADALLAHAGPRARCRAPPGRRRDSRPSSRAPDEVVERRPGRRSRRHRLQRPRCSGAREVFEIAWRSPSARQPVGLAPADRAAVVSTRSTSERSSVG